MKSSSQHVCINSDKMRQTGHSLPLPFLSVRCFNTRPTQNSAPTFQANATTMAISYHESLPCSRSTARVGGALLTALSTETDIQRSGKCGESSRGQSVLYVRCGFSPDYSQGRKRLQIIRTCANPAKVLNSFRFPGLNKR